jgi:ABC-type phosphate transport system substrate-binding protein
MLRRPVAWVLCVVAVASPVEGFADDIVIIVNRDNTNVVDASFVQRVYVGTVKGWPDGTKVMVLDQPEGSEAREAFCASVLKKSVTNVKAIWSQNIFTGKALPPKITTPDLAIKQTVASNVGAIGYIHASQLDATVKVLGK